MRGEKEGSLGKLGERRLIHSPSVDAAWRVVSSSCASGPLQFSRLPDSATLAPLRLVELASHQGRGGCIVAAIGCGGSLNLSLGNTSLLWMTTVVEKRNILSNTHQ